ncbi:hypothetical protein [Rhodohalobacter sp.]|uniref:hypothetical protein n=1 Tax=Rhodohalobacter sp. TaxID=1974210 RepID=UPI002ACDE4E3|nr:hypothetical protein [Rhodohalobacter sp.]MDZ7758290.1 hypothetical protein [Rhodohalobacter sp.]
MAVDLNSFCEPQILFGGRCKSIAAAQSLECELDKMGRAFVETFLNIPDHDSILVIVGAAHVKDGGW